MLSLAVAQWEMVAPCDVAQTVVHVQMEVLVCVSVFGYRHVPMCTYEQMYRYICMGVYIYIYIYIERERDVHHACR